MRDKVYWITGPWRGRLAILPRPRGGDWLEDETRGWRAAGIDAVVTLLEATEESELDLGGESPPPHVPSSGPMSLGSRPERGMRAAVRVAARITHAITNAKLPATTMSVPRSVCSKRPAPTKTT